MSQDPPHAHYVRQLFTHLLGRAPTEIELESWTGSLAAGLTPERMFDLVVESNEYKHGHQVTAGFPAGHFYSSVVNPAEVRDYVAAGKALKADQIAGIAVPIDAMRETLEAAMPALARLEPRATPSPEFRYHHENDAFAYADGMGLALMMERHRPRRIIEIGSGHSSARILDLADALAIPDFRLVCVEPYPARLKGLMRPHDVARVDIIEAPVQHVSAALFAGLAANDMLFIDSTHVLKTGSDVHYELFTILPALQPGVVVHVHDIQYPFEYLDSWIFDLNYSWNESYALRAFLMYNPAFQIEFWMSALAAERPEAVARLLPPVMDNSGGSLWLRRV